MCHALLRPFIYTITGWGMSDVDRPVHGLSGGCRTRKNQLFSRPKFWTSNFLGRFYWQARILYCVANQSRIQTSPVVVCAFFKQAEVMVAED